MKSNWKIFWLILIIGGGLAFGYRSWIGSSVATEVEVKTIDDLVSHMLDIRAEQTLSVDSVDFGEETEINILLLGLDERKEETELEDAHCDAIHMFTLDVEQWTIHITSVPRGTGVYIPGGPYAETDYYLANACAFAGIDYGVSVIEQIVGVKADYVATVGFSQTHGILRLLDLPTTESLQWLRHRQSYAIGEPQRAANQATFMKDVILGHITTFESDLTVPLQYLLWSFVDTDMPFSVAHTLLQGYVASDIDERPDDITTQLRPYYETQEIHFDLENYEQQLFDIIEFLRPYLSEADLSEMPLEAVQELLIDFVYEQIAAEVSLHDIVEKQLWLQLDDADARESLHYDVLSTYVQQLIDSGEDDVAAQLLADYILEKELLGEVDWQQLGQDLLEDILSE